MKELKADLHVHTCLSPCAEPEMVPTAIVRQAKRAGLDLIGICDHNSAENVEAVVRAGRKENLPVVAGIEITSREEVHILGFFEDLSEVAQIQDLVYDNLAGENDEEAFGAQTVVNECDEPVDSVSKLLIGATVLPVEQVVQEIHGLGGLAVASHIDREGFSILGQLGFIPEGLSLDALEVSPRSPFKEWEDFTVVTFSDAHFLEDIGKSFTTFVVHDTSVAEVGKALQERDGRKAVIR